MGTIAEYVDRYRGRRFVVVGKGPTEFQFPNLASITDPIIFINDAVQFECFAVNSAETFFFAHDECQAVWLTPELSSTAVLPRASTPQEEARHHPHQNRLFAADHVQQLADLRSYITYEWEGRDDALLDMRRDQVASDGRLYANCGTIHSAIHFAWLCGATEIAFIGCDGTGLDYDERIENRADGPNLGQFARIRRVQDMMCERLGVDAEYVQAAELDSIIPRLAHVVWFGDSIPDFVHCAIEDFNRHNPTWYARLWQQVPLDMPMPLQRALDGAEQICQQADIMYVWLLYSLGGVVFDTDSITLRSFEPLRRHGQAWTTRHNDDHKRLTNGVMGSIVRSRAFARCVQFVATAHEEMLRGARAWARCMYGPDMLTELFTRDGDGDMTLLPWHYFYPWRYVERETARAFGRADDEERRALLDSVADRFIDGESPYAVHLWGINGSSQRSVS